MDSTEDSLTLIRNKVREDAIKSDFKRKLIGGINEEDVANYINMMRLQSDYAETELRERIDELTSSRDVIKHEFDSYLEDAEEEKKRLIEELKETKESLGHYISLSKTKDTLLADAEENYNEEMQQLNTSFSHVSSERDALKDQLNDTKKELDDLKAYISEVDSERRFYKAKIHELENEIADNIKKFNERSDNVKELEQQLEQQKLSNNTMNKEIEMLRHNQKRLEESLEQSQKSVEENWYARELALEQLEEVKRQASNRNEAVENLTSTIGKLESQLKGSQRIALEHDKVRATIEEQLRREHMNIVKMLDENKELHSKTLEFSDELNIVYQELESVKEQVKMNFELHQQLELERLKSEKVEKEMNEFLKSVSELKSKIHSNQYQLDGQFKNIGDKYQELQGDLKGLHANVQNFKAHTGTGIDDLYSAVDKASKVLFEKNEVQEVAVYKEYTIKPPWISNK